MQKPDKFPYKLNRVTAIAGIAAGTAISAISFPALSQEQAAARATLEEVIVTAQRRAESQQDVAISMTVLSQEQLANANMTNSSDLADYTPGLSINNRFGPENASFSLRGFTKALRTTASVGVYFAEVAAPRGQNVQTSGDGAGPGTMFDLENIQVLKGPQGTLFGRNTTGGAILFVPRKPADEFEAYVEFSAGDYNLRQQQAVINLPISERFKLRLGLDIKERDGHLNNITGIGSDELGNADYTALRASALFDVTDNIQNYTVINYADSETYGTTSRLFDCTDESPTQNPVVAFTGVGCQQQLQRQRDTGQDGWFDVVSTVSKPIALIEDLRIINKFSWDITETITINNILAYSELLTENTSDIFGTQFTETQAALLGMGIPGATVPGLVDPRREFSPGISLTSPDRPVTDQQGRVAEIQVQGLFFDGRLDWQAGLYYEDSLPNGVSGNDAAILISCDLSTIATGDPNQYNCFDATGGVLGSVSQIYNETTYRNKAVYAQATYDVLEWFSITAGARYTWDDTLGQIRFFRHTFAGTARQAPIVANERASQHSEAPTGLFELQFRPWNDVMVYGKYVRGYRQGSVNMAADFGIQTHDKETVDTFELGAKTTFSWPIPGRFNVSVFDNDFTDMQLQGGYVSPTKGPTTAIFNAGSAEIRGGEIEAYFQLTEDLSLALSYSRLITELLEQDDNGDKVAAAGGPIAGATYSSSADVGETLPFAQDKAYTANVNYRLPLPHEIGMISVGATYIYTGAQRQSSGSSTPFDVLAPYSLINANITWNDMFGVPLDLNFFVTNVQDKEYEVYLSGTDGSLGFTSRQMGLPRMYGARLRYNF
ncbi:TonB-dependent receptor [Litorivivens sp.]|uniref:TonB-dependent receptor n=1 Tax=Litorivivens sp. TaxID=2020868 RepID=UPI00356AADCD